MQVCCRRAVTASRKELMEVKDSNFVAHLRLSAVSNWIGAAKRGWSEARWSSMLQVYLKGCGSAHFIRYPLDMSCGDLGQLVIAQSQCQQQQDHVSAH